MVPDRPRYHGLSAVALQRERVNKGWAAMINLTQLQMQIAQFSPADRASITETLREIVRVTPDDAQAWLCLSASVATVAERRACLERARRLDLHNPTIAAALRELQDEEFSSIRSVLANSRSIVEAPQRMPALLGNYLQEGGVTAPMIDRALALQRMTPLSQRRPLLGEILVQEGWSTPAQVADLLIAQTRARLQAGSENRLRQLGEFLLERGDITLEQLHAAILTQLSAFQRGQNLRLGEVLVANGVLHADALAQALREQEVQYQRLFY
jgi:hypothetical protein